MSRFKAQILLTCLSGNDRDHIAKRATQSIVAKGRSHGVASNIFSTSTKTNYTDPGMIAAMVKRMPQPWRLYLVGMGSSRKEKLGTFSPADLAWHLACCGLAQNPPEVISIVGCRLGYDAVQQTMGSSDWSAPKHSYAGDLHGLLGKRYKIYTTVHARTVSQKVFGGAENIGHKVTKSPRTGLYSAHQPRSKVVLFWQNGESNARYAEDDDWD